MRIRPYTQVELIAAAAKNNGFIVDVLSVPLNVLIDMGDQKTREHDPEYLESYIHEKLIPESHVMDGGFTCMGNTEYMVVGHIPGNGNDESSAPEGEVLIQFTGNVEDIVSEIKNELELGDDTD
jgi:hypothetical protein